MNTARFGQAMLKLLLLLSVAVLLCSCNAHQQEREILSYLCECNADGSDFKLLCRNNYSIQKFQGLYQSHILLFSYPFKIEHGIEDDLFAFRDDGIFKYDRQDGDWREYLTESTFAYRTSSYLHSLEQSGEYYFTAGSKLYRMQRDGSNQDLLYSSVKHCTGIPYQSHFSVLTADGLLQMENGNLSQQAITLPEWTSRAYYFSQADIIVYVLMDEIWRCDADGSNAELIYILQNNTMVHRSFYPIDDAGRFITSIGLDREVHMLLIDATDGSVRDLGIINLTRLPNLKYSPFQLSRSRDGSKLLFHDSTALYLYDLASHQKETVLISGIDNFNLRNISSASISADGAKINFICDVYKYK